MSKKIFVNVAVKDLKASMEFFRKLGYTFNMKWTDETAACMVISDDIYAMLLTEEKFQTFTPKKICDSKAAAEVMICLTCDSRAEVDDMVRTAVAGGGSIYADAKDYGFMYGHGFQDLDGHIWELVYLDEAAAAAEGGA